MDKALKQRLVGATVLIALAVIVLPMLLSGPPSNGTPQSQKIELPPRPDEVAFETRRFPLGEPDAADEEPTAEPASPERLPVPETAAADTPETVPGPTDEPAGGTADAQPADTTQAAAGEEDIPPPEVVVEPAPTVTVKPAAPARPETAPAPGGRYVVQVASLGSDANARKLMENLQQAGLGVLIDTVESDIGRLSRVRVGPYETEAAANAAVGKIRATVEGVNPRVVDLRPDDAAPVTSPGDPLVRWVVQVGSFSDASNADGLVERLRADGMSAYGEAVTTGGAAIHRVRVGPFLVREDALAAREKLIAAHSLEGVVMTAD